MTLRPSKLSLAAIIGSAAAAALVAFTGNLECSKSCIARGGLAPFDDTVGAHVKTVCFGETNVPMRKYTLPECKQILASSLAGYAEVVSVSTPGFSSLTDGQKIAAIDYTYNRGIGAWRSTDSQVGPDIRSAYIARNFPAACDLFLKWAKVERQRVWFDCSVRTNNCYGIYTRRSAERAACLGE